MANRSGIKKSQYTVRSDGRIQLIKNIDGKRVYFYGKTKKEVESKYQSYLRTEPQKSKPKVRNFNKCAGNWWEEKEPELAIGSIRVYRARYEEIKSHFGNIPVSEITPKEIIAYLRRLQAQGFSQKVINNKKSIIKGILDNALIAGEIDSNPCINLPTIKGKPKVPRLSATDTDIKAIEAHKNDSDIARMVYFILWTGCRRGEAAALQWKHIDRKNKTAHICQTLAYSSPTPQIKPCPKTAAGDRLVYIPEKLLQILPTINNKADKFVFFPKGLPREREFQVLIDTYRAEIGLSCTLHQLRHSYATMLHSAGVDVKDAQYLLGHSSITVTQDIYTEVEKKAIEKAAEKIEKMM